MSYSSFSLRKTPQNEPIPGQNQVRNNAGGFVYGIDKWKAFERFLIMGSEGGTYYVSEQKLTRENALQTIACIEEDGPRAVRTIVEISDSGRAPKNDPAIFCLALAASAKDVKTRQIALDNLSKVCRIPTHLFHFVTYVKNMRGFGRSLRDALAAWYNNKEVNNLAYQLVKYQSRDGWSNKDVIRLGHPKTDEAIRNAIYRWATGNLDDHGTETPLPKIITAFETFKGGADPQVLVQAIKDFNLSREMLPSESLKSPEVWEALLDKMPPEAMLRNLGNMSKVGLLKPLSDAQNTVIGKLVDRDLMKKARIHPIQVLVAMKIYASGKGMKGDGQWVPVPAVVDALDSAFYDAFDNIEPTGKRLLLAVDMSGSMMGSGFSGFYGDRLRDVAGTPLHPCEIAAAMAMVTLKKDPQSAVMGFADTFKDLGISSKERLDTVVQKCLAKTFGRTDCALPMVWATRERINVDGFIVITDNETYVGNIHPSQALKRYREISGINAKQIVMAVVPNKFSIADPNDQGALDIAGFDTSTPAIISNFIRGE